MITGITMQKKVKSVAVTSGNSAKSAWGFDQKFKEPAKLT